MSKQRKILLILSILLYFSMAEDLHFGRSQVCIDAGPTSCNKWNTTINLSYYYYGSYYYMCFPQQTRVQTPNGPQTIKQLKVGDQVLAYDFEKAQNVYSPVTAWIHRDTDSSAQFTVIKTFGGNTYIASSGHNIAFNNNGTIGFKYADDFNSGDELITTGQNFKAQSSTEKSNERGLYSPMTKTSNFYIFPDFSVEDNDLSNSMILVHCLAQIDHPQKKQHWIHTFLHLSEWLGLNSHVNEDHQEYLHPVTYLMHAFGDKNKPTKILIGTGDQNHFQALDFSKGASSWGSSWSSGSWGSSYGGYGYGYGTSSQQNAQNKKRQLISVFTCLMQVNQIIISL